MSRQKEKYRKRVLVYKDVEQLISEDWSPKEIYYILQAESYRFPSERPPTLRKVTQTFKELIKDPEVRISRAEWARNRKISKGLSPDGRFAYPNSDRKTRFWGVLFNYIPARALKEAIAFEILKQKDKKQRGRVDKYVIANNALDQVFAPTRRDRDFAQNPERWQFSEEEGSP